MKLRKLAFIAAALTMALNFTGCDKLMSGKKSNADSIEKMKQIYVETIEEEMAKDTHVEKPDLSQLSRNDFNHAALRLNLPIFWIYEENPSKEVTPGLLTTLNFYPTSDTFQWKNDKGEFTEDFYRAYNQMVEVMKSPLFGAAPQKDKILLMKKYQGIVGDDSFESTDLFKKISQKLTQEDIPVAYSDIDMPQATEKKTDETSENIKQAFGKAHIMTYFLEKLQDKDIAGEFSDAENARLLKVAEELDQAAVTVVASDFSASDDKEKAFVEAMLKVGSQIDTLYARQVGIDKLLDKIPESDVMSRSMVRRNWGVDPESPKMKNDKSCRAISGDEKIPVGIYPEELQKDPDFCAKLEGRSDSAQLLGHFSVIVKDGDDLKSVPYSEYFKDEMTAISASLKEAASILEGNEKEAALRKYLNAAADSFLSNDWNPADEAWAAMNSTNSAWYVRVAPDETYWEPCSHHAGFHMTFARINPDALSWQAKLTPLQQDMEKEMAKIAGKPYQARKVSFHLPDFIDIVTNSGDDRDAFGATIGQSLPNWGPVANEGRGRTVAMSNLYTDPDSLRDRKTLASSMFTEKDMELLKDGKGPGLLSTILHEAAHNLGPAHEYAVTVMVDAEAAGDSDAAGETKDKKGKKAAKDKKGKKVAKQLKDKDIYGGALASMAEEFKAQTAALWYLPYLVKKGAIDKKLADQSYADSVYWAFGHISKGMTTGDGQIQPYSQLAAIQIGMMLEDGALRFDPEAMAANGTDKGAFVLDLEKMPKCVERIMKAIAQSKAKGDKEALVQLQKKYVEGTVIPFDLIKERMLRLPKTSFVYSVNVK